MGENLKVIFDTQIYLRSAVNPGSACGRLFSDWSEFYVLHVTNAIETEIVDVFSRPKIRTKFPQISEATIRHIKTILGKAERIEVKPDEIDRICRDPKDDIFLACAKVAQADYLISEDKDLLVLQQHHGTKIVNVTTFLGILEQKQTSLTEDEGSHETE